VVFRISFKKENRNSVKLTETRWKKIKLIFEFCEKYLLGSSSHEYPKNQQLVYRLSEEKLDLLLRYFFIMKGEESTHKMATKTETKLTKCVRRIMEDNKKQLKTGHQIHWNRIIY
jgi:hypothetical protein